MSKVHRIFECGRLMGLVAETPSSFIAIPHIDVAPESDHGYIGSAHRRFGDLETARLWLLRVDEDFPREAVESAMRSISMGISAKTPEVRKNRLIIALADLGKANAPNQYVVAARGFLLDAMCCGMDKATALLFAGRSLGVKEAFEEHEVPHPCIPRKT